jgi:hypothetical protein
MFKASGAISTRGEAVQLRSLRSVELRHTKVARFDDDPERPDTSAPKRPLSMIG